MDTAQPDIPDTRPHTATPQLPTDLRPARLRAWLNSLPLTELDATARHLLDALGYIKQRSLPARQRFALLEEFIPLLGLLLPELATRYTSRPLPMAREEREAVELSTALQLEIIHAYQQVLTDSSRVVLFGWRRLVATSIHRLFRFRSNILCNYRLCYMPYPPGVWKQLYWFYQLVEDNGLLESRISDPLEGRKKTSILQEFKRLLLLSLLSPNSLERQHADEIHANLREWIGRTVLYKPRPRDACHGQYLIDLDGDRPPHLQPEDADGEAHASGRRCFDTRALVDFLRNQLARPPEKLHRLSHDTIESVLACWDRPGGRDNERHFSHQPTEIAIGFSHIRAVISGQPGEKGLKADLVDQSNSGYCFTFRAGSISIGLDDLVALRDPEAGHWRLGQIRWMQSRGHNRVRVGAMLLSPEVMPAVARDDSADDLLDCLLGVNQPHPVIYFQNEPGIDPVEQLNHYTRLVNPEREARFQLLETFAGNAHFDAFRIEMEQASTSVPH